MNPTERHAQSGEQSLVATKERAKQLFTQMCEIHNSNRLENIDIFFSDLNFLQGLKIAGTKVTSLPAWQICFKKFGTNSFIRDEMIKNLRTSNWSNPKTVEQNVNSATLLGFTNEQIAQLLPKKSGYSKKQKVLLLGEAALIATAGIVGYESPKPGSVEAKSSPLSQPSLPTTKPIFTTAPPETATSTSTTIPTKEATPTQTKTPTLSPTPIPTNTPTPLPTAQEAKPTIEPANINKNIFKEHISPNIYNEVLNRRAERAKTDPQFYERINKDLNDGRINILITGGRDGDLLTDSIQLLSYDIATNTLSIISLPRDLQSPEVLNKSKDPRNSRINQAIAFGGTRLLKEAVENATAIAVDFSINTGFGLLVDLINQTVGTINVNLDGPITDNNYPTENYGVKKIFYPAGDNKLTGEQALEVARSRYSSSDYARSDRQQKIIKAFVEELLTENPLDLIHHLKKIDDLWYQKVDNKTLKPDFDINQLFFSQLWSLLGDIPSMAWDKLTGGSKIAEMPSISTATISSGNFVVGAGIPEIAITKIDGGNPNTSNPRGDYWQKVRNFIQKFLTNPASN